MTPFVTLRKERGRKPVARGDLRVCWSRPAGGASAFKLTLWPPMPEDDTAKRPPWFGMDLDPATAAPIAVRLIGLLAQNDRDTLEAALIKAGPRVRQAIRDALDTAQWNDTDEKD